MAAGLTAVDTARAGEITRLVSASDSTQQYAVYVPRSYTADQPAPLVLVMDPRGRARLPLERMAAAAERFGYLLVSSFNTLSDHAPDINDRAVTAMLEDAQAWFAIDDRRIYLAGMSGTARTAWTYARRLRGHVAGILGFAAGLPGPVPPGAFAEFWGDSLVYFGGAGTVDYNYHELRALDVRLQRSSIHHRIEYYEGAHGWPEDRIFLAAFEWIEFHAMRNGLRAPDSGWIADYLTRELWRVEQLERAGEYLTASERLRGMVRDGAPSLPLDSLTIRLAELEASADVRRVRSRLARLKDWEEDQWRRFERLMPAMAVGRRTPERAARDLGLADLFGRAVANDDQLGQLAARRVLQKVLVHASFYGPRQLLDAGKPQEAEVMLELATYIRPDDPDACGLRTRVAAQLREIERALQQLPCVLEAGGPMARLLLEHDDLLPLRDHPVFRDAVGRYAAPQ